jgi:hypothetical protein
MAHCHRFLIGALVFGPVLVSCGQATSPGIEGRWAAAGIELTLQPNSGQLRLVCTVPAQLDQGLVPDSAGNVTFWTLVQPMELQTPYRADFVGHFVADALVATVTLTRDGSSPVVRSYTMLRNGDSGLDKIYCAL